ncbi:sensor histidine kinase YesM [Dyadobacter sp. BE34]|uniref:Sensor histidine kinase YesM n=1 Tax=Dyadobacter fermentans TaxID=94254 RepID=A0ABU1QTG9_9BACT|nr:MULTISPECIES: histidine kinase [Dyadobacter]MDR6804302.1 sensor histidine kinase YesM [Dyadobacter fermentans]MDR7042042.1 sensor histidine kinase YesM [Dyadobacter sp. BE242]MDR7196445.1 sensor histidine kinase YesM [Dyadobacter sp. BE34]MDR7213010.1 sensor histidine kinase YesM [Dyadobacter sp. BE31]MDR7261851.1 sensor histidine kinase YesM [Dyadobacter sp. BE32]
MIAQPHSDPDFAPSPARAHWFFRYKLYHIPFWIVYHYIWWVVALGNPVKVVEALFTTSVIKFLFYVVWQALAVYFNLYFLVPRYLEKGRYVPFLVFLLLTILATAALIVPGYYMVAWASGKTMEEFFGPGNDAFLHIMLGGPLSSTVAAMTFAMSIKLAKNWLQTQQRQQMLEKEKLETELNFLKYQFNPHFLFNSINSIFFLIHKNPDRASASLAKFSELLRHQLYECNDHQIPLSKEIAYLENFIELEKLRQNDSLEVVFEVQEQFEEQPGIVPFILMTFMENAFKHVSRHQEAPNWIRGDLQFDRARLIFNLSNSISEEGNMEVVHYGGIGLKNVRRRLDLIYPGKYKLDTWRDTDRFVVHFEVELDTLVMTEMSQMSLNQVG